MRIAVGGFQHETNTFSPHPATLTDFETPDAWPGLVRGPDLIDAVRGINLPAAGFIDAALADRHSLLPLTWCSATPSGRVTRDAFEHICGLLIDDVRSQRALDAVYLDLHGAMVAQHVDDADGEILQRVRAAVGSDILIVASLDFHANVSERMVSIADVLFAYRTYPHVDMSEAGARVYRCLSAMPRSRLARRYLPVPFLVPLTSQCTLVEPMSSLMQAVAARECGSILSLNFTPGFPAADVAECGPAVFGYGSDDSVLAHSVAEIASLAIEHERDFALEIHSIRDALHILATARSVARGPIILADTQDNPGAGGTADTTSLLKALHAAAVPRVLAGVICDPIAAMRAHSAGVGADIDLELAGRSGLDETPFAGRFKVLALGDGRFTATGPFYSGARMNLGPMALLRIGDLHIAVSSRKQQAADQAMFRHLRAEPSEFDVLVLKSSVHFRADFGSIASRILIVDAPGVNIADPAKLGFTKVQRRVASRSAS